MYENMYIQFCVYIYYIDTNIRSVCVHPHTYIHMHYGAFTVDVGLVRMRVWGYGWTKFHWQCS